MTVGLLFGQNYEVHAAPQPTVVAQHQRVDFIGDGLRAMYADEQTHRWRLLYNYLEQEGQRARYYDALVRSSPATHPLPAQQVLLTDDTGDVQSGAASDIQAVAQGDVRAEFVRGWRDAGGVEGWLPHVLDNVIPCESGWDVNAYNWAGPYHGLGQWLWSTWWSIANITGYWELSDPYHQGFNFAYKTSRDGGGEWGCW